MVDHAPRDLGEWMRSIERKVQGASRAASSIPLSYNEELRGDILADTIRHPAAPVEITYQTSLYTEAALARQWARIAVDFPDVTKATDGTVIPIMQYELWGRDDSTNYLEATTSAAAGVAAPGITFPGLAATPEQKAKTVAAMGPWKLLSTSVTSSLRHSGMIPGAVWTFRIRALGQYTTAPGVWSQEFQTQMAEDTTPPPQTTAPELISSHGTITVKWDGMAVSGAMPADFDHVIVAAGTSSSPMTPIATFYRGGGLTVISGLEYYTPHFVRFQAVDVSGNRSNWSEQATAYTAPLVDADIILSEIDANRTTLRNINAEALADGVIVARHLAENAITLEKLAQGAVTLEKLESTVAATIQQGVTDAAAANATATIADAKAAQGVAAAATAQGAATAAGNAATIADGKAVAAQQKADQAVLDAAAAKTAGDNAGIAAATADGKAVAAQQKANQAFTDAAAAKTSGDNAGLAAAAADGKAVAAQADADQALLDAKAALDAGTAAEEAAALADQKAVAAQTKANTAAADALTAQGDADEAAAAAAVADGKAAAAQQKADTAFTDAGLAKAAGDNAAILANKIVTTSTSAAPATAPPSKGALWNQTNAAGDLIINTWTANADGTAWVLRKLDDAVIGNLNAATINAGILNAARLNATDIRAKFLAAGKITAGDIVTGTLTSASGVFGTMDASVINSGTINAALLNAADIRAKFLTAGKITAADIVTGTLTSASGVFGTLDASVINTGTLNAARLAAGDVRAKFLEAGKIVAADMVAGTLTSASGVFGVVDASTINAGTLNAGRLAAGDVRAKFLEAGKITAADIVTGTLTSASGVFGTIDASVINAGTLDAARLNAGDIRAKFLTAGKVTAADIVAGTLTSASGVFGIVDASVINAGTLSAARLLAGDVRAKFLEAGKVTAADMVTGTITAASGVIGSLDIGKVSVGKLAGAYIAANTISVAHLLVSNQEEWIPNPYFHPSGEPVAGGTVLASTAAEVPAGAPSPYVLKIMARDNHPFPNVPNFPVKPGEEIYIEAWVAAAATTTKAFSHYMFRSALPVGGLSASSSKLIAPTTVWTKLTWTYVVPAGAPSYVRPVLQIERLTGDTDAQTTWYVTGWSARRKAPAELIVDGSITADKIATNAVTAGKILAGSIGTNHMTANSIDADRLVAQSITADKIRAGSITIGFIPELDASLTAATDDAVAAAALGNSFGGKWLYSFLDNFTDGAAPAPSAFTVPGVVRSYIPDGPSLVKDVGETYRGCLRTMIRVASATTLSFTATHDDAGAVYLDGVRVYLGTASASAANISFPVSAGWHVLELTWHENTGGDGWSNISPTIGSQVAELTAPTIAASAQWDASQAAAVAEATGATVEGWSAPDGTIAGAQVSGTVPAASTATTAGSATTAGTATTATSATTVTGTIAAGVTVPGGQVSGAVPVASVPSLPATKITSGTLPTAVVVPGSTVSGAVATATTAGSATTAGTATNATNVTGTIAAGVSVPGGQVTGAVPVAAVPNLDAAKIVSGTLPVAVTVPGSTVSGAVASATTATTAGSATTATNATNVTGTIGASVAVPGGQVSGAVPVAAVPNLDATKIVSGTLPTAVTVPGGSVSGTVASATSATSAGSATNATNVTGTIGASVAVPGAQVSGTVPVTAVPALPTSRITNLDTNLATLDASAQTAMLATAYSKNPSFDNWTATVPADFTNWGGVNPTKDTTAKRVGAQGLNFNVLAVADQAGLTMGTTFNHMPNTQYVTVEIEFMLKSGTLGGSGVLIDWSGMANNRATIRLADEVPDVTLNKWHRVTITVARPTNATGTWTGMAGFLMANYSSMSPAVKNITFDWLNVRPATGQEIMAYQSRATLVDWTQVGTTTINGGKIFTGSILANSLGVDSVTAEKIKALNITTDKLAVNAVEADKIKAGAITAVKLESTLVLTSTIIAGPPTGTHARMDSQGFRVFAQDLSDGIPNEVVRMGVAASGDYFAVTKANNEPAATISDDGKISSMELHAKNKLSYMGREMVDILMDLPQGLIAYGDAYTGINNITTEYGIFDIKVTVQPGRAYEITQYGSTSSTSGTGGALHIVRIQHGGGAPTLGSWELKRHEHSYSTGLPHPIGVTWLWYPQVAVPTDIRLMWSINKYGAGAATWHGGEMSIKDVGRERLTVGTLNTGGGTTAPPVEVRQARWETNGFRNYKGDGAQYPLATSSMYQGQSPAGYGNLKSIATFGTNAAGQTIAQALAGATVNWIRVYFNFQHWYNNSGGLAQIGVHNHSGVPATFSGSGGPQIASGGWPKPGARWLDLPSSTFAGFKAGTLKGVYLEGIAGDYGTYGYADLPTIDINYTK